MENKDRYNYYKYTVPLLKSNYYSLNKTMAVSLVNYQV